MGTQTNRFRKNIIEKQRSKKLELLEGNKNIADRKLLGQYNTPHFLSKMISQYSLKFLKGDIFSFLEPAIGSGSFLSSVKEAAEMAGKKMQKSVGVDIDDEYLNIVKKVFYLNNDLELINKDFFDILPPSQFDLLISNPPYIRHQRLSSDFKKKHKNKIQEKFGITVSGLSDMYIYYTILSHDWIKEDGIVSWLLPSEFLDVNYGKALKEYLLNEVTLLSVHRFDPSQSMFSDANITSTVITYKMAKPTNRDSKNIRFSFGDSIEDPQKEKYISIDNLKILNKWSNFENENYFERNSTHTIGELFTVKRGIATGDNNFFILNEAQIQKYNIDAEFLKPILPSPRYLKTNTVKSSDDGQPLIDNKLYLLDIPLDPEVLEEKYFNTWRYIATGIGTASERYITKNRKVWYWQEKRESAPIVLSYMSRSRNKDQLSFRFIRNLSDAIATNSYLMLYPKKVLFDLGYSIDEVYEMLIRIEQKQFDNEGRVYGGGLKKIEPKELPNIELPL